MKYLDIISIGIVFVWSFIVLSWSFYVINNSMKWKKKYRYLKKNLSDAFALMIKEDCEREEITNEIVQSLWLGHPLKWFQCCVCNRWRPLKKTGVNEKIIRDDKGNEIGQSNVVFCSDIEDCITKAQHKHHV